jgi:hypothetical protein
MTILLHYSLRTTMKTCLSAHSKLVVPIFAPPLHYEPLAHHLQLLHDQLVFATVPSSPLLAMAKLVKKMPIS